jgi:heme exporter protein C
MMKKYWWKILTVVLLLYVILAGLLTPLSPAIVHVSKTQLDVGPNTGILVTGYNTHFDKKQGIDKAWLQTDNKEVVACAENIKVVDEDHLTLDVTIPPNSPSKSFHLFVSDKKHGLLVYQFAFRAEKTQKGPAGTYCPTEGAATAAKTEGATFPNRELLYETIRNLLFHVPMWFSMVIILLVSVIYSIKHLNNFEMRYDVIAKEAVNVGLLLAVFGLVTGSIWAKFTWSEQTPIFSMKGWWVNDAKLNGAAVTTLIYIAYNILRGSINEDQKRARIAAVYNIFAFALLIVFIFVLPRLGDTLHPGQGGNPAFSQYDLDNNMRKLFYPAVIGFSLLGWWIVQIRIRMHRINEHLLDHEES